MIPDSTEKLPTETLVFASAALLAILLVGPIAFPVPFSVQVALLTGAVVILGLPHGALDPWIAKRAGLYRRAVGLAGFNLAYLALASLVVVVWWLSPGPTLGFFLLLSAWHFSDDWQQRMPAWQRLVAATALLGMPAFFNPEGVAEIFVILSGTGAVVVADILKVVGGAALGGLALVMAMAYRQNQRSVLIELGVLLVLAATVPPLIYFTVYFCLLHSPRHLRSTFQQAQPEERTRVVVGASVYTIAAVALGAIVASIALPTDQVAHMHTQVVFIGLAALTVPHMALMLWVEKAPRR
jgi:Brp/Blh family beta-carotene 15,15'-monooxygenase